MRKLNIVMAATGVSSLSMDYYLEEASRKLREVGHRVWLVRVNPKKVGKHDLPVFWSGPNQKFIWLVYLLCPYFWDRTISHLVNKAIRKIKEPLDIVDLEIPSLLYCYQKRGKEKLIVRGWYSPHQLLPRLRTMFGVGPRDLVGKFIFMIRQAWYFWGDEFGFKKADLILCLTENLALQLKKRGFKTIWIPLSIKVDLLTKRGQGEPVRFGFIAYDLENPRKGVIFFLKAVKLLEKFKIAKSLYQAELIGGCSPRLLEMINSLGLRKRVILWGRLEHQQTLEKIRQWEIFVFPTLFEELSMATVEAMAAGLACVGWKIDALEAAWGKVGILIPKGNVKLLAKTMTDLITNPKLREKLGFQAWQRAKRYFDWEVVVSKLERIYLKATEEE